MGQSATPIPALAEALEDERPEVRERAAISLGKIGRNAEPVLAKAISDDWDGMRLAAVAGFKQFRAESSYACSVLECALKTSRLTCGPVR